MNPIILKCVTLLFVFCLAVSSAFSGVDDNYGYYSSYDSSSDSDNEHGCFTRRLRSASKHLKHKSHSANSSTITLNLNFIYKKMIQNMKHRVPNEDSAWLDLTKYISDSSIKINNRRYAFNVERSDMVLSRSHLNLIMENYNTSSNSMRLIDLFTISNSKDLYTFDIIVIIGKPAIHRVYTLKFHRKAID